MLTSASLYGDPVAALPMPRESARVPVPGETALLTAGGLGASGRVPPAVVTRTTAEAILGGTMGPSLQRRGGLARRSFQSPAGSCS